MKFAPGTKVMVLHILDGQGKDVTATHGYKKYVDTVGTYMGSAYGDAEYFDVEMDLDGSFRHFREDELSYVEMENV